MSEPTTGGDGPRRVRVATVNLPPEVPLGRLTHGTQAAAAVPGVELVVLPETCQGALPEQAESLDGPTIEALSRIAREQAVHLLVGLYRQDGAAHFNSSVLLDPGGTVAGIYDKRYPYWDELDRDPLLVPGGTAAVWTTPFGRIGSAICFDLNFPHVWADLADAGADLVVWPSAYPGGTPLRSYAQIHHLHVLSCTQTGDSRAFDPTGEPIAPSPGPTSAILVFDLGLGTGYYHHNFNAGPLANLLAEHGSAVALDDRLGDEQWYVLHDVDDGSGVRALAGRYGLEELNDYLRRSRHAIDERRARQSSRQSSLQSSRQSPRRLPSVSGS